MKLTSFQFFAFFLCSSLFGVLGSTWAKSDLITDREVTLLAAVFSVVLIAFLAPGSTDKAINDFLTKDVGRVHQKQLADLTEAHRRHVMALKTEHSKEHFRLYADLNHARTKFDRLYAEHDYLSSMLQDQMRSGQEQEDRINYLEKKLQEFGQSSPVTRTPLSAPASQLIFSNPPRRQRSELSPRSPFAPSPLSQVVKAEEEE
ncbi:hypothetical protein BDW02DRAFT_650911 [Decorospora gaudefroyi]|uniref:Uncharacterized protein n=1 Tax=Decorospora gaudefroyi TaxID=184978 RepID=A0A6A5K6G2_9PLEO|nr:hypothetical protein BDW02DRAFT_650911 [Decorospora gaudefroyi]